MSLDPRVNIVLLLLTVLVSGCLGINTAEPSEAEEVETGDFEVNTVYEGLEQPWGIEFIDADKVLITENQGGLALLEMEGQELESLEGAPVVDDRGQGGMLDVELHPDYPEEQWVYLTYSSEGDEGGSATRLGRGKLNLEDTRIEDFEVLETAEPFVDSNIHFGSRVVFDNEGLLYFTVGDRGDKEFSPQHVSQDTSNLLGTTVRLNPDGTIPEDNPFVDNPEVHDAIYSYGHRNVQGMTLHPETRSIWQSEHGEEDGDEINIIQEGGNYGWPLTHTGCRYGTDQPVGDHPEENSDTVNPVYYWECNSGGFPPAGMTFYSGAIFEEWQGDLFIGNLAGQYLGHFDVDGRQVEEKEPLLEDRGWRIRDIEDSPDGYLYLIVDGESSPLIRLEP